VLIAPASWKRAVGIGLGKAGAKDAARSQAMEPLGEAIVAAAAAFHARGHEAYANNLFAFAASLEGINR